eukprot:2890592-Lingulodinium_polyedra.AAC.1
MDSLGGRSGLLNARFLWTRGDVTWDTVAPLYPSPMGVQRTWFTPLYPPPRTWARARARARGEGWAGLG